MNKRKIWHNSFASLAFVTTIMFFYSLNAQLVRRRLRHIAMR